MKNERFWFLERVKYKILNGKEGIKKAYDLMAKSYDDSKYLYWTRRIERGEEKIINKWIEKNLKSCLDVGCGTWKIFDKNC